MLLPFFSPFMLVALVAFACCLISAGIGGLLTYAKFKKRKFIKTKIIIALSVAGIITLYFLFYTVSNMLGRNSVKAMWDKVAAAGLATNPEEIIPQDPNYYLKAKTKTTFYDTRNLSGNAVLLYEAAIALLKNSDVTNKRFDIYWKCQGKKKNRAAIPQYNVPMYDVPNWPNEDKAEAIELSKNKDVQQALTLFSRGTRKLYAVNLRYYTDIKTDIQAILPRLNSYRELFRMISFVNECYALEGEIAKAYKLSLDGFKFIHQFRDEPVLVSHLVYIACAWINLRTLNSLVARYGISSQKARQIIKALNQLNFNKSAKKGLHGNLVLFTRPFFKKLITGDMRYINSSFGKNKAFADCVYLYPFNYQEYASYIGSWLKNYELYDKPYWQIKSQLEKLNKEKSQFLLMKNVCRYLFSFRIKIARMNSICAATKIILALHIYKNKHGNFPERLSSLTPGILKKIIVDPITGKAYGYKKEGKSFKLTGFYSGIKSVMPH